VASHLQRRNFPAVLHCPGVRQGKSADALARASDGSQALRDLAAATYMFLHGGIEHILFNMLALWMFGTTLSRTGARAVFSSIFCVWNRRRLL
jgi:hypothetical protein